MGCSIVGCVDARLFSALLIAMTWVATCTGACTSGMLRMKAYPEVTPGLDDTTCWPGPPQFNPSSIKALCNVEVKVTVNSSGIVKWAPVALGNNCQLHNASGLFTTAAKSAATLMFYDNVGGPLSSLTKTSATEVTLTPGGWFFDNRGQRVVCIYNYTVVSGCVLGAKPPPKLPACPAGYILKTGAYSTPYCSPCPPGESSLGRNSRSCTPCPVGTYSPMFGGRCRACPLRLTELGSVPYSSYYAPKAATIKCQTCNRMGGNKWGNATSCNSCPAGSFWSRTKTNQCVKCSGGMKCCTVNWTSPSGDCPKCPASGGSTAPLSSIFALDSASTPACLASTAGLCAPKIEITVDQQCLITVAIIGNVSLMSLDYAICNYETQVPIQGVRVNTVVDLAKFPTFFNVPSNIFDSNVTASGPSHLQFRNPSTKCIFNYRALTTPAAALLGVGPKPCPLGTPGCPSIASTCPAGSYLETASTAKPAPCIRCPPGTYSAAASSGAPCTRCAPGTYTRKYGSTTCTTCTGGLIADSGSAYCGYCDDARNYPSGANTCTKCPANTYAGDYQRRTTTCLGNAYGSICCAAGNCTGQPRCPSSLPSVQMDDIKYYTAVMQLVAKDLPLPACRAAKILSCLQARALVTLEAVSTYPLELNLNLIQASGCDRRQTYRIFGSYTSIKTAEVQSQEYVNGVDGSSTYVLQSDSSKGTIRMHLNNAASSCSATFKLISGYAFDLSPPAGAKCPSTSVPGTVHGRTFCTFCSAGSYQTAAEGCNSCPAGTYQDLLGATTCKPCPAGSSCMGDLDMPFPCSPGTYSSKAASALCTPCPKNTFAGVGAKRCAKCPAFTKSVPGSQACGVFW